MPRSFVIALLAFFLLGLASVPAMVWVGTNADNYLVIAIYLVASALFWVWLFTDGAARNISQHWQVLVGMGWQVAPIPIVPIYLIATRGWKHGSIAILVSLGVIVGLVVAFIVGLYASNVLLSALHITANISVHTDSAPAALRQ